MGAVEVEHLDLVADIEEGRRLAEQRAGARRWGFRPRPVSRGRAEGLWRMRRISVLDAVAPASFLCPLYLRPQPHGASRGGLPQPWELVELSAGDLVTANVPVLAPSVRR